MSADTPGTPATTEIRYFLDGCEITEDIAKAAEAAGGAKVVRGASGVVPSALGGGQSAWLEMESTALTQIRAERGESELHRRAARAETEVTRLRQQVEDLIDLSENQRAEVAAAEQRAEELHERTESLRTVWLASQTPEELDAVFSRCFARWDEEDDPGRAAAVADTTEGGAS